jgi:hypothetical protein
MEEMANLRKVSKDTAVVIVAVLCSLFSVTLGYCWGYAQGCADQSRKISNSIQEPQKKYHGPALAPPVGPPTKTPDDAIVAPVPSGYITM